MPSGTLPDIFISTRDAGKVLGCGSQSIETGLRNGSFPVGWAWTTEEKDRPGQWNYRIPREAFARAIETGTLLGGGDTPSTYTSCRLYKIWADMKQRCTNPNCKKYALYGGRGISYDPEWDKFPAFEAWSYAHGYREYLTLDRIRNDQGYEPDNCRWATYQQQANNTRRNHLFTIDGETHDITEWSQIWGIPRSTARNKIYRLEAQGSAQTA